MTIKLDPQKGLSVPSLTTTEKNNIVSPEEGALVFDVDLNRLFMYHNGIWNALGFTGKVSFLGAIDEKIHTLSGTTPTLDPSNGTIQIHTLTGNTTYSEVLEDGESITLMIDDGSAYTVAWPTLTWKTDGGSAPSLLTTGYTTVTLWKVGSVLYAARVGDN